MRREIDAIVSRLPADVSCVATGSIIEGFGNSSSDIDLYVIHDEGTPKQSISIGIRKSRYVDCEYMTRASVTDLLSRVENLSWGAMLDQPIFDINRYYRISIGIPVVLSDGLEKTLQSFDRGRACTVFERWSLLRAYEHLARASTALAFGAEDQADVLLREGVLWHANSRLAAGGEGYPAIKWTGEKAARLHGRGTAEFDDLLDDSLRPEGDLDSRLERLRSRLRLPDEPAALITARSCGLSDGVAFLPPAGPSAPGHLALRGRAVAIVKGVVAAVCARLAEGADWAEATRGTAEAAGVPHHELMTAAWFHTAGLRSSGLLRTDETEEPK
ncbi:hypothetical protein [Streptomyces sp. NBRC 109706]|uniref:hypothetical protein n=1 Tax=Streptomyces sp. NBRC 109706 TaxID=1550035 RepID=UPI000783793E|nr:hypothetical protein [Streptomyces sp. NBRC 109706]